MRDEGLDVKAYWTIIVRWWWILILGAVGAALAGFLFEMTPLCSTRQVPRYL